jgi:hypothetical protein
MKYTDWIGSIGVAMLLLAFFLNLRNIISKESITYLLLNTLGAGIACLSAVLIRFWPFIILEACWMITSLTSLIPLLQKKNC